MSEERTPGPWFWFDNRAMNDAIWIGPAAFVSVAEVRMGADDVLGDVEANAALIASAPDLLAALVEARAQLEAYELAATGETYNSLQINAAIAKASQVKP